MLEKQIKIENKNQYYKLYWFFLGLKLIINISDLITIINLNFKVNLTKRQEIDIENKIVDLRNLVKTYYQDILKYNNYNSILDNHLNQLYIFIKDFINKVFFEYMFCQIKHIEVLKNHNIYEVDLYYEYEFINLENKFVKQYLITLKSLNKNKLELEEIIQNYENKLKNLEHLKNVAHNKAII